MRVLLEALHNLSRRRRSIRCVTDPLLLIASSSCYTASITKVLVIAQKELNRRLP